MAAARNVHGWLIIAPLLPAQAANAALVWSMAPDRSYGNPSKMPWQQMLAQLPNNVWDKCHPQRQYTRPLRAASFVTKVPILPFLFPQNIAAVKLRMQRLQGRPVHASACTSCALTSMA